jgi:hypothetical protein
MFNTIRILLANGKARRLPMGSDVEVAPAEIESAYPRKI